MSTPAHEYTMDERALISKVEKTMEEMMSKFDVSHDAFHVQRVRRTAIAIARSVQSTNPETKVDLFVVELAALMHDMLDKKYVSAELASDPEAFFTPLLSPSSTESDVDGAKLDLVADGRAALIARIVDNVSWSTEKKRRAAGGWKEGSWEAACVELHCVQDADRLDAIGAFGVMRCAAYSAVHDTPLHFPPAPATTSDEAAPRDSVIQHFHDKLLHIKDRMKTGPGKKMAEKRHAFMLSFLSAVDDEYDNTI
ncbi:hypothetical protein DL93DRAFT_2087733 [Clavulina sp. PMI_390]|nr:hypothetical protein DL93DRAFT_2087733 [Clavulina sp. PMI_390]